MSTPENLPPAAENVGGGHGGASGRWMTSYADFITLMMVVFMVLYSMARVDSGKYGKLKASLQSSSIGIQPLPVGGNPVNTAAVTPGPDPNSAPGQPAPADPAAAIPAPPNAVIPPVAPPEPPPTPAQTESKPSATPAKPAQTVPKQETPPQDPMTPLKESLQGTAAARAGKLNVSIQDRGLVVSILTQVLFDEGTTHLKPGATALLNEVAAQLKGSSDSVLVEGSPDANASKAPWDLAVRRGSTVVDYLVSNQGLAAERFAVIGYGKGDGVAGIVNVVVLRRQ